MLRKLARRYLEGEEIQSLGQTPRIRLDGLHAKIAALRDANDEGFSRSELLKEVAQIEIEEEETR